MKLQTLVLFVFFAVISCTFAGENATRPTTQSSTSPSASVTGGSSATGKTLQKNSTVSTHQSTSAKGISVTYKTVATTKKHSGARSFHASTGNLPRTQASPKTKTPSGTQPQHKTKPAAPLNATTPKPEVSCNRRNSSCSECIDGDNCFYCDSDNSCREKKGKLIPTNCKGNHWYWKQCKIPGNILIIVIPTVGGVVLIMLCCCIYCCCCRRCSRNRAAREESSQHQRHLDRQERKAERRANRKERLDAIKMKYGLLQNEDEHLESFP